MDPIRGDRQAKGDAGTQPVRLVVGFDTPHELLECFERELLHGAMLVDSPDAHAPGTRVVVGLELRFCGRQIEFESEVVAPVSPHASEQAPDAPPTVSLRFAEAPGELRQRLGDATGLFLPEPDPTPPGKTPRAPRFDAVAPLEIQIEGRRYIGETANLSYNGVLALISGTDLAIGSPLSLRIDSVRDGTRLELAGKVANIMPCDAGVQALGVQFLYDLDRFDEVSRFVDGLRSMHHARALAALSGSLEEVPLETVLETFANSSSEGTLHLRRGGEKGRIAYRDGDILYATAGLETGERALARMFCWTDARFELEPEVGTIDAPQTPLPLTSALLLASVERDEMARLDLGGLAPDTVFAIDQARLTDLDPTLDELSRELVANAAMGFPVATLLDMVAASDAAVYKAIGELVDAGVLRLEKSADG